MNLSFAKNLKMGTCGNMNLVFMEEDAAPLGRAMLGLSRQY